jgi:hypothetical protein
VFGVHVCVHSGAGRTQKFSCHVEQLRNLEALGVSTAITRFLSVLSVRTVDESGKVQVATIAARVNILVSSNMMGSYLNFAAIRPVPPHHARHKLRCECNWSMWERVYTKLRLGYSLSVKRRWYSNYLDRHTLPSTGGDWEVFLRTLEEIAVDEQGDVEGSDSELLMHESWTGHRHTLPLPTSALHT